MLFVSKRKLCQQIVSWKVAANPILSVTKSTTEEWSHRKCRITWDNAGIGQSASWLVSTYRFYPTVILERGDRDFRDFVKSLHDLCRSTTEKRIRLRRGDYDRIAKLLGVVQNENAWITDERTVVQTWGNLWTYHVMMRVSQLLSAWSSKMEKLIVYPATFK